MNLYRNGSQLVDCKRRQQEKGSMQIIKCNKPYNQKQLGEQNKHYEFTSVKMQPILCAVDVKGGAFK